MSCQQISKFLQIPKAPVPKRAQKYRSPDPSPLNSKNQDPALKENLNQVTKFSKKSSTSPISRPSPNVYSKDNLYELEEYIYKYHPALASKNLESSKQEHEKLDTENKALLDMIISRKQEIHSLISQKSSHVKNKTSKIENEIDLLNNQLSALKAKNNLAEKEELSRLVKENKILEKKIVKKKIDLASVKEKGIKQEDYFLLQEKIISLETTQNKLLEKNFELKKEHKDQVATNLSSKIVSEQKLNLSNIWNIFCLILKLQKMCKKYITQEQINLSELITVDELPENTTISAVIAQTRKEICNLRVLVSDIYAENCGITCQSQ